MQDAVERREIGRDADVDDVDCRADLVREHVDGRATAYEVADHLRGDVLRPGGDSRSHDTVIAREDRDGGSPRHHGWTAARDRGELHAECLEPAQGPGRLRQLLLSCTRSLGRTLVDGRETGKRGTERARADSGVCC